MKLKDYSIHLNEFLNVTKIKKAIERICKKKYENFNFENNHLNILKPLYQEYFSAKDLRSLVIIFSYEKEELTEKEDKLLNRLSKLNEQIIKRSVFMIMKRLEKEIT